MKLWLKVEDLTSGVRMMLCSLLRTGIKLSLHYNISISKCRMFKIVRSWYSIDTLRPVSNVVLLPCRTQMKLSFRFKLGSSTPFETIKRGTAELSSA